MRVNREAILEFFDVTPNYEEQMGATFGSHVSAISGLIGEDLVLGLFLHFWNRNRQQEGTLSLLDYRCLALDSGRRLDAWLALNRADGRVNAPVELLKVEVKNWSYHSIGMRQTLPIDADNEETLRVSRRNWNLCIEAPRNQESVYKVIEDMRAPEGCDAAPHRPVLCFWAPIFHEPQGQVVPYFAIERADHPLSGTSIFSASLYLRTLDDEFLEIPMPRVDERLGFLQNMGIALR